MNWKSGLFRIWLVCSVLWLAVIGYQVNRTFNVPAPFFGDYQYSMQTKEMPWKIDWSKSIYEIAYPPGKGTFPETFFLMTYDLVEKWDAEVAAGRMMTIKFPDRTNLYISSQYTKEDQETLSRIFWEQRWSRYLEKIWPWLALAFAPLYVLLAAALIGWITNGFRSRSSIGVDR